MKNPALDKQAVEDTITIEDVKRFIMDAREKREDYLNIADRSWSEIEKRNKKGRLYGGNDLSRARKWTKFPLWWSCLKIRQPITFARLPVPVLKDTQGDDPYGRTACVIGERLARGILKTFEAYPEFAASNDDFLVTNFGWGRAFYRRVECVEDEKLRLQAIEPEPMMDEQGMPTDGPAQPIFITPEGTQVDPMEVLQDEEGPYLLTGRQVSVDQEEVYFDSGLYSNLYIDPDARRWNAVSRLAFEYEYSYREFKKKFGDAALNKLAVGDLEQHRTGKPIIVFEYWDKFLKECRWFAENSMDFFQPAEMAVPVDGLKEVGPDHSDLYGLSGFFPCVEPLLINASTKDFWPTPEYFQVCDLIDDIHSIVGRMALLTKAIRVRFLFDSSIRELAQLISETGEGGGLGVPNLQESLIPGKGTLDKLVAYFPTDQMITGLGNMYTAFQQRLDMFYQVTGISDLIRGQTNPDSDKTYGERQMEGKFALNRIEPFQRKLQTWIKDNYQLLMEMALKCFSDESLDEYITPQTLDQEDKERYVVALELLKSNKKRRFRVEFETDSTIAINEQWRRSQAVDLANTLTKAMESTANVAETQPELAATELKVLKHLIGEFADGKLFVDEIQDSIQQVIDKVAQPEPPEPDYELEKLKLEGSRMSADLQFKQMQLQMSTQLEYAKLSQKAQAESVKAQLEQMKVALANGTAQADIEIAINKLQSEVAQGWADLTLKKEALLAQVQAEVGKKEMERMRVILDARVKAKEIDLAEADQMIRTFEAQVMAGDAHASLQERIATERRLQEEHESNKGVAEIDAAATLLDALKTEPPKPAPVSIDMSRTLQVKESDGPKKTGKRNGKGSGK